jgi:hypothetical protein
MKPWSIYLLEIPPKWVGVIEAATAERAIKIAAEKFKQESKRLVAFAAGGDL